MLVGTSLGCGAELAVDSAPTEANDALATLRTAFGGGKADLASVKVCDVLRPLRSYGDAAIRSAFFAGVEGEGALGVASVSSGFDVVFDLYHHQVTVSRYAGTGIRTPALGGSLTGYVGLATGFRHGVSDWDGYFVSSAAELSLPFLKEVVSLQPAFFVTGVDKDGDHRIEPSEVLVPPNGVYGALVGVSFGFNLLPTGLPVGASSSQGRWEPHRAGIRSLYDRFASLHLAGLGRVAVRLMNPETGKTCPGNWPREGGDQPCVIELGPVGARHSVRALHQAFALCRLVGGCTVPLSWQTSGLAIAIGALRDAGGSFDRLCASDADGNEPCRSCIGSGGGKACADRCSEGECRVCVENGGGTGCIPRCGGHA
jgi:hypothetical protein